MLIFTFDFEALYDSITPKLVEEAICQAMKDHRDEWGPDFRDWLIDLVKLSMQSAVGVYQNTWFKPKNGIPTGGSLRVQMADIAVYYALSRSLYKLNDALMKNIEDIKRFIDDGTGMFNGSDKEFDKWKKAVTENLAAFGLKIKPTDWNVAKSGETVNFLDIRFGVNEESGEFITDLFRKETDSRAYLNFGSCHPNHVFSGIIYSQALRLRRIINTEEKLIHHLGN